MDKKFTEYSGTGGEILLIVETMLIGIQECYDIHYGIPTHNVARKILNEIDEIEPEAVQDQRARERAAKEVRENADKSGG